MNALTKLKQRADYTHRYNIHSGRHGWLRLTPAYSVKIVEEILSNYESYGRVLDPFCGSGTTSLCAARLGLPSATTDINPFLLWLAKVKNTNYSSYDINMTHNICEHILDGMGKTWKPVAPPPIHKITRWWSESNLSFLCDLKGAIEYLDMPEKTKDLFRVSFCRTLIKLSNAAFNHQSMSFKQSNDTADLKLDRKSIFCKDVEHILSGCTEEIRSQSSMVLQDARTLKENELGYFDIVITSPPYANRMSYIRELRPYMYWLGYLKETREAGELDWQAIGGTWGIATSRLKGWQASEKYKNEYLSSVIQNISKVDTKHAVTLSRYVHRYHEDIYTHLRSLTGVLNKDAKVHYIIGNSTFYGILVSVENIYADIMEKVGFSNIDIKPIRKRNSKKELIEFSVSANW